MGALLSHLESGMNISCSADRYWSMDHLFHGNTGSLKKYMGRGDLNPVIIALIQNRIKKEESQREHYTFQHSSFEKPPFSTETNYCSQPYAILS